MELAKMEKVFKIPVLDNIFKEFLKAITSYKYDLSVGTFGKRKFVYKYLNIPYLATWSANEFNGKRSARIILDCDGFLMNPDSDKEECEDEFNFAARWCSRDCKMDRERIGQVLDADNTEMSLNSVQTFCEAMLGDTIVSMYYNTYKQKVLLRAGSTTAQQQTRTLDIIFKRAYPYIDYYLEKDVEN